MRTTYGLAFLLLATACGGDDGPAAPTIVPGGGARDPGISDRVHVYVIDERTDQPIVGATVLAGTVTGTTDATGLFTATGVSGPLTVAAKATDHATAVWVGVDSQNITMSLEPNGAATPSPAKAEVSGTITGWDTMPAPPAGHIYGAVIGYSQNPEIGADDNNLDPPANNSNVCLRAPAPAPVQPCNWRINSRVGTVVAYATMVDLNQNGTPSDSSDDTFTITGYATSGNLTVAANTPQTGVALTPLTETTTVQPTLGTPPAGLTNSFSVVGVDLGAAGVLRIPPLPNAPSGLVLPTLSVASGATYELLALASEPVDDGTAAQSIVLRRGITSPSAISAGEWMPPPTGLASDRTMASFTGAAGAAVHSLEFDSASGSGSQNRVMTVLLLDGSTTVALPVDFSPLPSGNVAYRAVAVDITNFDNQDFAFDDLTDNLVRLSSEAIRLP